MRIVGSLLATLVLCLTVSELLLRVPRLFGHDPAEPRRDPGFEYILCVGDSFTRGVDGGYPHHLQNLLDDDSPDRFRVVNLGRNGQSSSRLSVRLASDVARYRPRTVIVWVGAMRSSRGQSENDPASRWRIAFERVAARSEVIRFAGVWYHDKVVEAAWNQRAAPPEREADDPATGDHADLVQQRLARDYRAIAELALAAELQLILITYPYPVGPYWPANQAMQRVSGEYGIAVINSQKALRRLGERDRRPLWALHPRPALYVEIARDLVPVLLGRKAWR